MSRTIAFLAEAPGSPSIEVQEACLGADDVPILAGRVSFGKLDELLPAIGMALETGDHVKVYDLTCLTLPTSMLIRMFTKLLRQGISIEIVVPGIGLKPDGADGKHLLLDALDSHYRHIHGINTHPAKMAAVGRKRLLDPARLPEIRAKLDQPGVTGADVARELGVARSTLFAYLDRYDSAGVSTRGRKRLLDPGQLPEIRAKLDQPGASVVKVAQEIGVARSTLFNFLERYGERSGGKKIGKRRPQDASDDGHIRERDADVTPV